MPVIGVDFDILIDEVYDQLDSSSSSSTYDSTHIYPARIRVNLNHIPQDAEADYAISEYRCKMITKWDSNAEYNQTLVSTEPYLDGVLKYNYFEFEIPNYLDIPTEIQRFEFVIEGLAIRRNTEGQIIDEDGNVITPTDQDITDDPEQFEAWQPITRYYTDVLVRKDLRDVMLSTITKDHVWDGVDHGNSYKYYIHNVPVILSNYLDDGAGGGVQNRADNQNYSNFEVTVMQALLKNLELDDRRMLTDFINIKFPDTYGPLNNLKYNPIEYVIASRYRTPFSYESPDDIIWQSSTAETLIDISDNGNALLGLTYPFRYSYLVNGVSVYWQETIEYGWGWVSWDGTQAMPTTGKRAGLFLIYGTWAVEYTDWDNPGDNDSANISAFTNGSNGLEGFTTNWGTHPAYGNVTQGQNVILANNRYIVNGIVPNYQAAGKLLSGYMNSIAEYYDGIGWYLIKPTLGMYVRIEDELDSNGEEKVLVYDGDEWKDVQSFRIPLLIDLKVEMDPKATMSGDELKRNIRESLVDHFSPYMGIHKNLDRSEIVTVVRQITGVKYCEIRKPEIDIKFLYDIKDLTQKQIIDYTPSYTGFVGGDRDFSAEVQDEGIQIQIVR